MEKVICSDSIFALFESFIRDSSLGIRTKKDGRRIKYSTVENYLHVRKTMLEYHASGGLEWKIYYYNRLNQREKKQAKLFNIRFYNAFTAFLYKKGMFDNSVGSIIKTLKAFYTYLEIEKNMDVGPYYKSFIVARESIQIIALSSDQLAYIMNHDDFIEKVKERGLEEIRDIFIFGCMVALRISDLMQLDQKNLSRIGTNTYLKVKSQKSNTHTSIKLPAIAIEILRKYKGKKKLLPQYSLFWFNELLKRMGKLLPDNMELIKVRERKGKQVIIYKDAKKKTHYTLADHLSSHVMRRTGITTMLALGMQEHLVRKISGHSPNSSSFYRYVQYNQQMLDKATDDVFNQLTKDHAQSK
jgi:site-specific recombinase XerD